MKVREVLKLLNLEAGRFEINPASCLMINNK